MALIPYTDPHCLSGYKRAQAAGLTCERMDDVSYLVSSEHTPGLKYRVLLTPDGYECQCWAKAHCKHGVWAAATAFPWLLSSWLLAECERIRMVWRERDRLARKKLSEVNYASVRAEIARLDREAAGVWPGRKAA